MPVVVSQGGGARQVSRLAGGRIVFNSASLASRPTSTRRRRTRPRRGAAGRSRSRSTSTRRGGRATTRSSWRSTSARRCGATTRSSSCVRRAAHRARAGDQYVARLQRLRRTEPVHRRHPRCHAAADGGGLPLQAAGQVAPCWPWALAASPRGCASDVGVIHLGNHRFVGELARQELPFISGGPGEVRDRCVHERRSRWVSAGLTEFVIRSNTTVLVC